MEITAMQKLIQYLHENKHFDVIPVAKELLKDEEEQIIDAWIATDNQLQRLAAEEYYNQKYNNDTTRTNINI